MGAHDRYWCSVYERLCMSVGLISTSRTLFALRGPSKGQSISEKIISWYQNYFCCSFPLSYKKKKYCFVSNNADGPSYSDSIRMLLNAKQCFSIYHQKSKEEKVKTFHFNYVIVQKHRLPRQERVKKGGFDGVSLGLFTPNFHLILT